MNDKHHVLHFEREWSLRPDAKSLRGTHNLIVGMDRGLHEEIHANCPPVPLLGHYALERTVRLFIPTSTVLGTIDNLMLAIEGSSRHPKAHRIERSLAELTVEAISLQREYLV